LKISVVIPAHNEEENLPKVVRRVDNLRPLLKAKYDLEIVVVNDGSTDGTGRVAEELAEKHNSIKVVHHEIRKGLTKALETGFKVASGDILIFIPADMESDPLNDIPKLLTKLNEGYDMVVGWKQRRSGWRYVASYIYNFLIRTVLRTPVHDANWIKAFRRPVLRALVFKDGWHRYFVVLARWAGFRVGEVKVQYRPREHGRTKYGHIMTVIKGGLDFLRVMKYIRALSKARSHGRRKHLRHEE